MKLVLDMVHHNPGEAELESAFLDPAHLAAYGYNGQVLKHINCAALFDCYGIFPCGSEERAWVERLRTKIDAEIHSAKTAGLGVYYHIDLFVLPKRLVELLESDICDPATGRISLERPKTLEVHRALFDEICSRFPGVDGLIVRVGETYLFDTPHHVGNSPIAAVGDPWSPTYGYDSVLNGGAGPETWTAPQVSAYVALLRFLRDELCVKHGKRLIFRTWDIFPDKLHAVLDHYLDVTDQVEPHPLLIFSIKHTALDFWRRVKVNECLTRGRHAQIVEVQCAREYEGKGAYPNYVMDGVFNGFEENSSPVGLTEILRHPRVQGVFGWSRGGGWYGPYIEDELWCDLHAYVLGQVASGRCGTEETAFRAYCSEELGLSVENAELFREVCLLSARAVLKGRYCEAFDRVLDESMLPTALWMRDDRLGGRNQLRIVFNYLIEHNLLDDALYEKADSVRIWRRMRDIVRRISATNPAFAERIRVSVEYGRILYSIVHQGWKLMSGGTETGLEQYDALWREYRQLAAEPGCASLYRGVYFSLPGEPEVPGLDDTIAQLRSRLTTAEKQLSKWA